MVMKKAKRNKTLSILVLISIVLCACPGCLLLFLSIGNWVETLSSIQTVEDLIVKIGSVFLRTGWMLCLSGLLLLIPIVLIVIMIVNHNKEPELEQLKPTGASKDDPIPPPS